eukprot:51923-Chlamydomonas_euryale.AAC.1
MPGAAGGGGGGSGGDSGQLSTSHGSGSALEMDPMRREANKVRSQLMAETGALAGKKDRTSPYGTPKGLASPLVQDAASLRALHLMPGQTVVDPQVQKDFQKWKQLQAAAQGGSAGGASSKSSINDFKKFSAGLPGTPRPP